METIKLDISKTGIAVSAEMQAKAQAANALLESGKGAGNDFLGWVHLPSSISAAEIEAIEKQAAKLREKAEVIICIGIGGSYLGAKAVLEAMSDPFRFLHKEQTAPVVLFAGQNISEDYTYELLEAVKEHSIATIVISKSGTTTEPAIAFRLIKAEIEKRYGKKEAAERIVAITDKARGALKTLATNEGYPTFVIPDDVGGRFSVLTPVGLLPLAAAGVDIAALVRGAHLRKENFDLFCGLMRLSYNDKHLELVAWAEDAAQLSREQQRAFLRDAARLLRESYMLHAGINEVCYLWGEELAFCTKFAPFIGSQNIEPLIGEIESALAQISQNGNPTIVFTHFALAVSKMIKRL